MIGSIDGEICVFTKGAPEVIAAHCDPKTIPNNFQEKLEFLTSQGYRVIAIGTKKFSQSTVDKVLALDRQSIEKDLTFLGMVFLENHLKPETKGKT